MGYRLLLDENVEHEVGHRLEHWGHDVEHVDFVPELGKGAEDRRIAQFSLDANRIIVTYDADFVLDVDEDAYRAALYFSNAELSVTAVADVVHAVSKHYPQTEIDGLEYVGDEWL